MYVEHGEWEKYRCIPAEKEVEDSLEGAAKSDQCDREEVNHRSERVEKGGTKSRAKKERQHYH